MENKCNKTPNNTNNNNTANSKYMDHVYCHTNQTKNSYNIVTTPGSIGSGGAAATPNADVLALLKENKQLKAMLILHLDLIQEQSDQLMAKEKLLIQRNEEIETLRTRNVLLDNQVKELQKQLQQQIKRSGEISTLPPPPLAKIQCKTNQSLPLTSLDPVNTNCAKIVSTPGTTKSNIIGECNGKLISKIVLQRVNVSSGRGKRNQSPQSQTTDTENDEDVDDEDGEDEHDDGEEEEVACEDDDDDGVEDEEDADAEESHQDENLEHVVEDAGQVNDAVEEVVDHSQESVREKTNIQITAIEDMYDTGNTTEDSNEVLAVQSKRLRLRQAAKQSLTIPRGAKPSVSPASTTTNDGQTAFKAVTPSATSTTITHLSKQPPTPSRGKQMTIMRWHAPDYNTDESVSCDSTAEIERRQNSTPSSRLKPSPNVIDKKRSHDNCSQHSHHQRRKIRRCPYISTPQLYSTREWEDEAFSCDYDNEFFKAEAKLLQADNPKLEIPKWTEHELTPSYCIEGTEDLSNEIFLKRHAKLEVDEKRRKKWDVQQIREQRRIERLKRRHCKDEIQPTPDTPSSQTFYPTTESLQTICFIHDLPVQAFGEMIPKLQTSFNNNGAKGDCRKGFQLPWLDKEQLQYINDNKKPLTVSILKPSETTATASLQMQQQMLNSSFIFLKKRRRQQSSSVGTLYHHSPRLRNQASKLSNNALNAQSTPSVSGITALSTTPTQSFLNIVKSNVASASTLITTPTTQTTASSPTLLACGNNLDLST